MTTTSGQKVLKSLETAMKLNTLAPAERARQEVWFELAKRIDHILYTEWDPCGVHTLRGFDCSDEYKFYLPTIVDMVMDGATFIALSDQLMVFEDNIFGDLYIRRRCDVIAVMVSHYGPHAAHNPFVVVINTETPESAHQSVLDLIIQTRIDTYQGKWRSVRVGYEHVVAICQDHLSDNHELYGACLSNLGMAYSKTGELEKALQMYAQALPELAHGVHTDYRNFMFCLKNAINNLDHRRQFAAAWPYYDWMMRVHVAEDGWEDGRTWEVKAQMEAARNVKRPAPKLRPVRINVERDGYTRIRQMVGVD